jgi:polysaccharide transporter, PST family
MLSNLIKKFSGLALLQGLTVLLPLLVVPHLLSTIKVDGFGRLSLAVAVSSILIPFIDLGYQLTGTREMADGSKSKSRLLGSFLMQRILVALLLILPFSAMVLWVPNFRNIADLLALGFLYAFVTALIPNWYFEGQKRFKVVQYLFLIWRLFYTLSVLLFIKSYGSEFWVLLLNVLGGVIALIICAFLIIRDKVKLEFVGWIREWKSIRSSFSIAFTPLTVTYMSFIPQVIASFLLGPISFGYFALVDRILQLFRMLGFLFSTIVYVEYCKLLAENTLSILRGYYLKITALAFLAASVVIGLMQYFHLPILDFLDKEWDKEALIPYSIVLWAGIFVIQRSQIQRFLLSFHREKQLARWSIAFILALPILMIVPNHFYGLKGLSFGFLGFEVLVSLCLFLLSLPLLRSSKS